MRNMLALLIFTILLTAAPAVEVQAETAESRKPAVLLDEVTVTANKTEEDVQSIPQAVTAVSAQEAQDSGLEDVRDLAARVPNLGFYSGGMDIINFPTLRGIRSDPHNNLSPVALYVDGVPVTSNLGYVAQMYDIERIEVLRGPQGTLYGRNSEGGVINVITRQPGKTPQAALGLEAATGYQNRENFSVSGEILDDSLYMGLSGQHFQRNGWVMNDYDGKPIDDKNNFSGRYVARYTPDEDTEMTFNLSGTAYDEGSFGMYTYPYKEKRHVNTNDPGYNHSTVNDQSLSIKHDIDRKWNVTSITSRRETDADYLVDYDFSTAPGFETHKFDNYEDISEELRFQYESQALNLLFGTMFDRNHRKVQYTYETFNTTTVADDTTDTVAAFTHFSKPLGGGFTLSGGMRVDYYTTDFDHSSGYSDSDAWITYSPKLALEYTLVEGHNLYTSISRGFRSAGYSGYAPTSNTYKFDEESLWAFEFGSKNEFLDKRLRLNLATFYYMISDLQVEQYINTAMGPQPYISNAGDTDAQGAEIELNYILLQGLEIFGSGGYTHIRYGSFVDAYGQHKGNHLPYVPDFTYSAGAQYRHPMGFFARGEVVGASEAYIDSNDEYNIPAYATVNAKIGWESEHWDTYLFADNLFNEHHDYHGAFGGTYSVATPGLVLGISTQYHY